MKIPQTLINREVYIRRIQPFMRKSIAKVLIGQRRVGKSFLLFQLMDKVQQEEPDANIIYLNFEDFAFNQIRTAEDMYAYISSRLLEGKYNYIFIDEIQIPDNYPKIVVTDEAFQGNTYEGIRHYSIQDFLSVFGG